MEVGLTQLLLARQLQYTKTQIEQQLFKLGHRLIKFQTRASNIRPIHVNSSTQIVYDSPVPGKLFNSVAVPARSRKYSQLSCRYKWRHSPVHFAILMLGIALFKKTLKQHQGSKAHYVATRVGVKILLIVLSNVAAISDLLQNLSTKPFFLQSRYR